jgi:hypothetical protein
MRIGTCARPTRTRSVRVIGITMIAKWLHDPVTVQIAVACRRFIIGLVFVLGTIIVCDTLLHIAGWVIWLINQL